MKSEEEKGETTRGAIVRRKGALVPEQIDGGWHITIYSDKERILIAEVVTTTGMPGSFQIQPAAGVSLAANVGPLPSTEYWWFDLAQLTRLAGDIYIQATWVTEQQVRLIGKSFDPQAPTFTSEESTSWAPYDVQSGTLAFQGHDQKNVGNGLYLRILVNNGQVTKVKWFSTMTSTPAYVVPATGTWTPVNVPLGAYQAAFSLGTGA